MNVSGSHGAASGAGQSSTIAKTVRRGARRPVDVPGEVLAELASGGASVNHMEQMAMDGGALLLHMFPHLTDRADRLRVPRFLDRLRAGAEVVWDLYGEDVFDISQDWPSDTARGWAAFAVPRAHGGLARQLRLAQRYADDPHFAVREWAWLGVRQSVIDEPVHTLALLEPVACAASPRLRRFAVEVTRPRGVWSSHIPLFKTSPDVAENLLDRVCTAPERYVRDSVANWLNDTARSRSDWVKDICKRWQRRHGAEVAYVLRRAQRNCR